MPEVPHYAYKYTLSTQDDVRGTWTEELLSYVKANTLWYALKHEVGDNYKLHIHLAFVYEIQDAQSNGGAKVKCNVLRTIRNHCPTLRDYLETNPSRYAVSCPVLTSDEWIASYLQKEGDLLYYRLPKDLNELKPYFAELQKAKPKNPEYEQWLKMYEDDRRPVPTTFEEMWKFFGEHMYVPQAQGKEIKIVADPKKLTERVKAMVCYTNGEVPSMPMSVLGKQTREHFVPSRYCPRCEEAGCDPPNMLEPREQFCWNCKNYRVPFTIG